VIAADLMAEAARARVDEYTDLALRQSECARRGPVEDCVDILDFQEMVPCTEAAQLSASAQQRAFADRVRISTPKQTLIFAADKVSDVSMATFDRILGAADKDLT
jgi:hypothetical protein